MKAPLVALTLLPAALLFATLAPRDDYQPIIDAKPFGDMAAAADTDTATVMEQQKQKEEIAQKFRMCGITDMPDGSRKIAFLDETSGTVASYLLAIGESENGFTLVSADYDREYATLSKDGLTFTLGLGKGLIDAPPAETAEAHPVAVRKIETSSVKAAPEQKAPVRGMSFKARLLKRQQEKEAAAKAAQAKAMAVEGDAVAKAKAAMAESRRKQIERIKQGLAPTEPITLTPEEDAELEAAGVFGSPEPEAVEQPVPDDLPPEDAEIQNSADAEYESQGI